jgi:hypothetical protein
VACWRGAPGDGKHEYDKPHKPHAYQPNLFAHHERPLKANRTEEEFIAKFQNLSTKFETKAVATQMCSRTQRLVLQVRRIYGPTCGCCSSATSYCVLEEGEQ